MARSEQTEFSFNNHEVADLLIKWEQRWRRSKKRDIKRIKVTNRDNKFQWVDKTAGHQEVESEEEFRKVQFQASLSDLIDQFEYAVKLDNTEISDIKDIFCVCPNMDYINYKKKEIEDLLQDYGVQFECINEQCIEIKDIGRIKFLYTSSSDLFYKSIYNTHVHLLLLDCHPSQNHLDALRDQLI